MPSWKKIITSGSSALLLNVTASSFTGSFTGSFLGTGSYATRALSSSFGATASYVNTLNQDVLATGTIEAQAYLKSMYQAGDEGGEMFLNAPATNTAITNGVTVDVYQNKFRIFEQGGSARGYFLDITSGAPGVGTDLKPAGYSGIVTILGNPPGMQNLNFTDGILISVT